MLRQGATTYRASFFTDEALSALFGRITKWPPPLPQSPNLLLPFLISFLKPTLALDRQMEPPQTDEMLNWGEPACPNDPPQKVGGVKKSASSAVLAR